jgi:hypothetical protein
MSLAGMSSSVSSLSSTLADVSCKHMDRLATQQEQTMIPPLQGKKREITQVISFDEIKCQTNEVQFKTE